jgi:hypothetical protein
MRAGGDREQELVGRDGRVRQEAAGPGQGVEVSERQAEPMDGAGRVSVVAEVRVAADHAREIAAHIVA